MQILCKITEDLLGSAGAFRNVIRQCEFILDRLADSSTPGTATAARAAHGDAETAAADSDEHIVLVVHNIDGVGLRSERAQTALSLLAELPQIHIVASVDHVNAPLSTQPAGGQRRAGAVARLMGARNSLEPRASGPLQLGLAHDAHL